MLLREHLNELKKDRLVDEAKKLDLSGYSRLKKAELIDLICEHFCTKETLRSRMACLTAEELSLFRRAYKEPQLTSFGELMDGIHLAIYWFGYFEDPSDKLCVFEDIAALFEQIDDEDFRKDQKKKGWMIKCARFSANYYGAAPVEIIYRLYQSKIKHSTIEDMHRMLITMPVDMLESEVFPMDMLGMADWPEDDPLYSPRGLFIHLPLIMNDSFADLVDQQMDKEFYIPSPAQLEELCGGGYEASSLSYKKLESFFMKELKQTYEKAAAFCQMVWGNSCDGESPTDVLHQLSESDIIFDSEEQLNKFAGIFMDAYNNTRMKGNRGHKPSELASKRAPGRMPVIVPGSSHAAAMLQEAAPQLREMGIHFDLDANADTITAMTYPNGLDGPAVRTEKKVYPNDPCPCGSGKKYKKCCGRR